MVQQTPVSSLPEWSLSGTNARYALGLGLGLGLGLRLGLGLGWAFRSELGLRIVLAYKMDKNFLRAPLSPEASTFRN